ncbi:MAG: nuclear transport factor 2 family protein [Candidatus Thorarchaeota archaeon]
MNKERLFEFCKEWLAAWTGNNPEQLLKYYHEDALYVDPAKKEGLKGHYEIGRYFERLLAMYPDWTWTPVEVFPIETGAVLKWKCSIPVGPEVINEIGLDIVEIVDGKITRNEVYFDRTELVAAADKKR